MITLETGQKALIGDQVVIEGGTFDDSDNVRVVNEQGEVCYVQVHWFVYGEVVESE